MMRKTEFIYYPKTHAFLKISKNALLIIATTLLMTQQPFISMTTWYFALACHYVYNAYMSFNKKATQTDHDIFKLGKKSPPLHFDETTTPDYGRQLGDSRSFQNRFPKLNNFLRSLKQYPAHYIPIKFFKNNLNTKIPPVRIGYEKFGLDVGVHQKQLCFVIRFINTLHITLTYSQLLLLETVIMCLLLNTSPVIPVATAVIFYQIMNNQPLPTMKDLLSGLKALLTPQAVRIVDDLRANKSKAMQRTLIDLPQLLFCRYLFPRVFCFMPSNALLAGTMIALDICQYMSSQDSTYPAKKPI